MNGLRCSRAATSSAPSKEIDDEIITRRSKAPPRLIVDTADEPAKKRKPNSGSFKKGEKSPNPNGRPKGAKGVKAVVRKVLAEPTIIRTAKGSKKITIFHGLLLKERERALNGDWRARKTMIELGRWAMPEEVPGGGEAPELQPGASDQAILDWYEAELRERDRQASVPGPKPKAKRNSSADDGEGL